MAKGTKPPVPSKQSAAYAKAMKRQDGWANAVTGLGVATRDKQMAMKFAFRQIDLQTLEALWRGDPVSARIVETMPEEMLREGWTLEIGDEESDGSANDLLAQEDPTKTVTDTRGRPRRRFDAEEGTEASALVEEWCEQVDLHGKLYEALTNERGLGGAAILLGVNDGASKNGGMRAPLRTEGIETFEWLNVLTPRELQPISWYADPFAPNYGRPEIYRVVPEVYAPAATPSTGPVSTLSMAEIHESRLIVFPGLRVTRKQVVSAENNGWGDSVLVRAFDAVAQYNATWLATTHLVQDFAQATLSVKGLTQMLAAKEDDLIRRRAELIDYCRSVARMVLLDADMEAFDRKVTSLAGLNEILAALALRVAAVAETPASRLFGQAPAGLNATGDSDIRWFYDRVAARQRQKLVPVLKRIFTILFLTKKGPTSGVLPERWKVSCPSPWQLTRAEEAAVRKIHAETTKIEIDAGVLIPEEVAASRYASGTYCDEIKLDLDARKAVKEEEAAQAEAMAAAGVPPGGQPPPEGGPPAGGPPPGGARARAKNAKAPAAEDNPDDEEDKPPARADYDPDQPRDEKGQFGSGGGGAAKEKDEGKGGGKTSMADFEAALATMKGEGADQWNYIKKNAANLSAADRATLIQKWKASGSISDELLAETMEKANDTIPVAPVEKSGDHATKVAAAVDHGVKATNIVKELRAAAKKDPDNQALQAKLKEAEVACKSARYWAKQADAATTPEEAAKALKFAEKNAARVYAIQKEAQALVSAPKSAPAAPAPAPATSPPAPSSVDKMIAAQKAHPALVAAVNKMELAAEQEPPPGLGRAKLQAIGLAKETLAKHGGATTEEELEAAAQAYLGVAKAAKDAGSMWGYQYTDLATKAFQAKIKLQGQGEVEKINLHEAANPSVDGVKTHVPATSARPIESIKGQVVPFNEYASAQKAFSAKLNSSERAGLADYTGSGYTAINGALRKGGTHHHVKAIDSALAKGAATKDFVVHRGIIDTKGLWKDLKVGDNFVEKGYSSTSAGGSAAFSGNVYLEITVPKGYPAAAVPSAQGTTEREILLRRNTRFQVTGVVKTKGKTQLKVTVVHDE